MQNCEKSFANDPQQLNIKLNIENEVNKFDRIPVK